MTDILDKLNSFIEKSCAVLREKMELMVNVYTRLMEGTDTTLTIYENNRRGVLKDDPVYNSVFLADEERVAMENRQMTEESYLRVLNGETTGAIRFENPNAILAASKTDLDKIPTSLSRELVRDSGVGEVWLLEKCEANEITLADLNELVALKTNHKSNMTTIFKFIEAGLSLYEVHQLYEIHADLEDEYNVPKLTIAKFCRYFACGAINYEFFAGQIAEVCRLVEADYGDTRVKIFMKFCKKRNIHDVQYGIEAYQRMLQMTEVPYGGSHYDHENVYD